MLRLSACPICEEENLVTFLSPRDHTVSHEIFDLEKCARCGFVMTNPRPENADLPQYYLSEAYISHSNRSTNLIDHVYRISRHFTLRWKYQVIKKYSAIPPASLLDFGCGTGSFLQQCQKHKITVTGVEPSDRARAEAAKNTKADIHASLSEVKGAFDVITLWHVLEHVPEFHETLRTLKAHLNDNGTMFIAVPNPGSYDAKIYQDLWAGYDVPRHLWHFSKKTMEEAARRHALKKIAAVPMKLDAYYVSLLSEKYKGNKNIVSNIGRALINGWTSNRRAKTTGEYSSIIYIFRK